MFEISKRLKEKFEKILVGFKPTLAPVEGYIVKSMGPCNPCTGCGNNCTGSCAGSCRGNCTGSCQRYSR